MVGSQVVSSRLHPDISVRKHPGSTGEETSVVGRESISVLGKTYSLSHGRLPFCSTSRLRMSNPSGLSLGGTNENIAFQVGLKTVVSHTQVTKPTQLGGKIEASISPVLGTGGEVVPKAGAHDHHDL